MSWSFLEAAGSRGRDLNGSDCLYGECHLEHALVAVRLVAGAGRGVFALSLIEPGTELWSESPLTYAESREALVQKVDAMVCHFESLCRKRRASSKGEGIVACNFFEQGALTCSSKQVCSTMRAARLPHCISNTSLFQASAEYAPSWRSAWTAVKKSASATAPPRSSCRRSSGESGFTTAGDSGAGVHGAKARSQRLT